jgi:glycosyltransferase involved in cell wall biosynthesis
MKLGICLITFNRLDYTKRTLRNLLKTIEVPYYLVVSDNNSTDGTKEYLKSLKKRGRIDALILNPENYYPGKATNLGWSLVLENYPQATHLMRLDNDMHFERGWDAKAVEYFWRIDRLGQLGLDFDGGENKAPQYYNGMGLIEFPGCVGGPNIIRRMIFDAGARYDETPWEGSRSRLQEDSRFSREIKAEGWLVGHMDERLSWTFADESNWHEHKDYYIKTMYDRGYDENVQKIKEMK